ncbi:MAG: hypothetical protein SFZ24_01310 [Planctomycetota bacterium]|nr:hypothetical protein [Planctomycetota bacterium]
MSMSRMQVGAGAVMGGVACWVLVSAGSSVTDARGNPGAAELASASLRGNLTVTVTTSGGTTGVMKDVDEVTLFDEWVVIRAKSGLRWANTILPRERVISIDVVE